LPGQVSIETLSEAERHLVRVVGREPNSVAAHVLLARIYLVTDRLALAEPHLIQASTVRPEFHLELARLYNTRGKKSKGVVEATRALVVYRARVEANSDDDEARLNWAKAVAILGEHAQAEKILQRGLELSKKPLYRQAIAQLFVAWSDTLIDDPAKQKLGARLALIDQGLRYDPDNLNLLERLQLIARLTGTEATKARGVLQDLLARGQESAALHLTLGIDASERNQPGEAALHFERAYQLCPDMPLVANNLAWSLATREPIDLPRALQLVDTAIHQMPAQPQFHGTRGNLLFSEGRPEKRGNARTAGRNLHEIRRSRNGEKASGVSNARDQGTGTGQAGE
jgi:tetratricopeptide (TPR) repeat protein